MGLRGPAPKPAQFRILSGRPGAAKAAEKEPKFKPVVPKCPTWLDKLARKEWARIGPELGHLNMLTSGDMAAFACYCQAYSDLQKADAVLQTKGRTFQTPNGVVVARPEVSMCNKSMKLVKDFAIQFGFTPSARGRISLPTATGNEDLD